MPSSSLKTFWNSLRTSDAAVSAKVRSQSMTSDVEFSDAMRRPSTCERSGSLTSSQHEGAADAFGITMGEENDNAYVMVAGASLHEASE